MAAAAIDQMPAWGVMTIAEMLGRVSRLPLPESVAKSVVKAYARYFAVNMADAENAQDAIYPTFDAFFTRRLRREIRPIAREDSAIISPCDGQIRSIVAIDIEQEIFAKNHPYRLSELLVDEELAKRFHGGTAVTIYLHPRDYHRVHSPCDGMVSDVITVPGRLLPVTEAALIRRPQLFAQNERMIHVLETMYGTMVVVMVAAFGVGHMSCSYRSCPPHPKKISWNHCNPQVHLQKGDELGIFHLGSTVILLTEPGIVPVTKEWPVSVHWGQEILRGNTLHGMENDK